MMDASVPMLYRVVQESYAPLGNDLVPVPYDPADKQVYLADTAANPNGFGRYQKGGPEYTFYMSRYEITNTEFVEFLNDAEANPGNARGTNMVFDVQGSVWLDDTFSQSERLFWTANSKLLYVPSKPAGQRYAVLLALPPGGGTYQNHPITGVSWLGALKYCNWLTIATGRTEAERCYNEGTAPSDWGPVTASQWGQGFFGFTEREMWLAKKGFRLPMDKVGNVDAFSEFYKAAAWNGHTNTLYSFGRDSIDMQDANFSSSGDPFEPRHTPVGYYDGSRYDELGAIFQTRANANKYGIFDLSGNVWELSSEFATEGLTNQRRLKGGSYLSNTNSVRTTTSEATDPAGTATIWGFRIVTTYP
jgi:formylglycine-generating enzyme required for sulfatase activity